MIPKPGRLCFFLGLCAAIACATLLDNNFTEEVVVEHNAIRYATSLEWAPDDSKRLFITIKRNNVMIVQNDSLLEEPFATLDPVYTTSECGVLGVAFDPDFTVNHYVYFFVTVSDSEQQIIRYTDDNNIGKDKTVIIGNLPTAGRNHDGGAILFGPDKMLYWAIGDNGHTTSTSMPLTTLRSKIGRARPDGSIPTDNPFYDDGDPAQGNNDYIWARGFRNPYTAIFHPVTHDLWLNVVGASYEQVFRVKAGDDGGWTKELQLAPDFIEPVIAYRTNNVRPIAIAADGAQRTDGLATFSSSRDVKIYKGEKLTLMDVVPASFNGDVHVDSVISMEPTVFTARQEGGDETGGGGQAVTMRQGGSISGGIFYDKTSYPEAYHGNFFYGDYNIHTLYRAVLNEDFEVTSIDFFAEDIHKMIDITVGPDGMLYYIGYSTSGKLYRARYTGPVAGNLPAGAPDALQMPDIFNLEKFKAFLQARPSIHTIEVWSVTGKLAFSFKRSAAPLNTAAIEKLKRGLAVGVYIIHATGLNGSYQRKSLVAN